MHHSWLPFSLLAVAFASEAAAGESFVPLGERVICLPGSPSESELLAVRHFNRRVAQFTGVSLEVTWGLRPEGRLRLDLGTRANRPQLFQQLWDERKAGALDDGAANQSYSIGVIGGNVVALGAGQEETARGALGLGYALGELLRRLECRGGEWGFTLPESPIVQVPKMPNRTLYVMNAAGNCVEGVSLEYWNEAQIDDYVDRLIEARFSRVSLWQWQNSYLYPGNHDELRPLNQQIHRKMRHFFAYARRRGLEVYHQLTPAHANVDLLPDDPKYWGTGYYGKSSICWSQPEARELALNMTRQEMEYYGPVDGYLVWFYDPGGCFCETCKANQAKHLFEQLMMVHGLAQTISPGAAFEACLWPTWAFVGEKTIPYESQEDVKALVNGFLAKCLDQFGPRGLTIMDSCEADTTNVYNGLVRPEQFKRNAFMYSVLGMAGECGMVFPPFRFRYLNETMGKARDAGLEEATLFLMYSATNFPSVYTFGDVLYEGGFDWRAGIGRYAATVAKDAESRADLVKLLAALEEMFTAANFDDKDAQLREAEAAWERLAQAPELYVDKDWLGGYVRAQRHYLVMARAKDEAAFKAAYEAFRTDLGGIDMYRVYMHERISERLVGNLHLRNYWLPVEQRERMVGWFE